MANPAATVLIVEDEPLVALHLASVVAECGHDVLGPAASMAEAMRLIEAAPPTFALIDVNLADGPTGPALALYLTQTFGTAVAMMTASPENLEEGRDGVRRIVRKPYHGTTVSATLAALAQIGR
jgi:response regulator of citrate/malate metabolism